MIRILRSGTVTVGLVCVVLAAGGFAQAALLCANKGGVVRVRERCSGKETPVDPVALGLLTPGPKGDPGLRGEKGDRGTDGSPDTADQIRFKLLTVDGSGSGLDADKLNGKTSADFAPAGAGDALHGLEFWQNSDRDCDWGNYTFEYSNAAYFRDSAGIVHLQGLIKATEVSGTFCATRWAGGTNPIAVLPPGYRPDGKQIFAVYTNGSLGRLDIDVGGIVRPNTGAFSVTDAQAWVSLSGISFRCAPSGQDGCP